MNVFSSVGLLYDWLLWQMYVLLITPLQCNAQLPLVAFLQLSTGLYPMHWMRQLQTGLGISMLQVKSFFFIKFHLNMSKGEIADSENTTFKRVPKIQMTEVDV